MTPLLSVQLLELAAFVGLTVASLVQWLRRRQAAAAWLAATFGALALVVPIGWVIDEESTGTAVEILRRGAVLLLAWFPYSLYRFTGTFSPDSGRSDRAARAATATVMATSLVLPGVTAPGGHWPAWYASFVVMFVAVWVALALVSVTRLWRVGRNQPALARRRMHLLAIAAVALTVALLALTSAGGRDSGPITLIVQAGGFASAVLFLLGFAPPYSLRAHWRRHEAAEFLRAEAQLMAADTTDRVAGLVLPQAANVVGGRGSVLVGPDGEVRAHHGVSLATAKSMVSELVVPVGPEAKAVTTATMAAVPMGGGWLSVATTPATPVFGSVELALLQTLAHLGGLALERAELYDRERLSREILAEREAMLAEAQRTARIGSYTWDLVANEAVWSDEMHRILGYEPGQVSDMGFAFAARIHPEDRERVMAAWASARSDQVSSAIDYRIALPSGEVRWLHGELHPAVEEGGAISRVTGTVQDITARKRAEEDVAFHASHDALTLLPNRALFLQRLGEVLARRKTRPAGLAVLFVDLDRFKWLNDSLGHVAGDEVLAAVAARLSGALRPTDTLARFGGDEFVALCEDVTTAGAEAVAARLGAALEAPFAAREGEVTMTASIGIAYLGPGESPGPERDSPMAQADALVRDADLAMYQAKEQGRDRYELFDESTRDGAVTRLERSNALRRGLAGGELVVHYQPIVDMASGRALGVEALARWDHPTEGLLAPGRFIPLAEETGLINDLGERVLRDACRQVGEWCRNGQVPPAQWVSVNLAPRQLLASSLPSVVEDVLAESGLDPAQLCLEITENALLEESESSARALRRLASLGVRIAVDDFGTGFSGLTYLKRLPVSVLKIDQSFVRGVLRARADRAIVANLVDLAHALGLHTIAEGVETAEQATAVRGLGCDWGQGFLWGRGMAAEAAQLWLAEHAGPHPHPESSGSRSGSGILVVDDDASIRQLLRLTLDDAGHRVVAEAADGREAVALARRHQPDVVILDLAMPGIGGLEALPLIQAMAPRSRVVVFSGLDPADHDLPDGDSGAVRFVTKGGDLRELIAELAMQPAG